MSIKAILDSLEPEQKRQLVYAFDNGFDQHIRLEDNMFVGVNVNAPNLIKHEEVGVWSCGEIRH